MQQSDLHNFFSEFAGLHKTALELGLGSRENLMISLNRGSKSSGRLERHSINTDKQLQLDLPLILDGSDRLQCK